MCLAFEGYLGGPILAVDAHEYGNLKNTTEGMLAYSETVVGMVVYTNDTTPNGTGVAAISITNIIDWINKVFSLQVNTSMVPQPIVEKKHRSRKNRQ